MHLTQATVKKFSYRGDGKSRDVRWDDALPGFGVRIYPSGNKAFVLSYRNQFGAKKLLTLGSAKVVTLQQARTKAKRFLGKVEDGADPLADKQKIARGETIADLCREYVERHAKPKKKTWKEDERRISRHITPNFGNRKAASITRAEVAALHHRIGKTAPYEANRTVELIRKVFQVGKIWGFIDEDHPNPGIGIERFDQKSRDRWVTHEELPRLWEAIERLENVYAKAAIKLYILTGVRKNELLGATWDQIDFERRELNLPDTKAGRPHHVPLSPLAVEILKALPQVKGNSHIFPGDKPGSHYFNIYKPWYRVRKEAGLDDVRLHDLRRTVGSWLATQGASLPLIGKTLNQTTPSTTMIYARLSDDPVRDALELHAEKVEEIVNGKSGAKVIPLLRDKK